MNGNASPANVGSNDGLGPCIRSEEMVMHTNDEGQSNAAHWHKRATEAEAEVAQARQTADYWKAEHLAGNARIGELHDELAATALRSADHLRKAVKAEAEVEWLRLKCSEHQDGRLAALERVAPLERRLQEIGDLAASSATGPAQFESLKMIEEMCGLGA